MTLEKFFLKEGLKVNIIIFLLISAVAFYSINMQEIKTYRKDLDKREENFSAVFNLEIENYKNMVRYLEEDRELDIYAQYGVYIYDREVRSENDSSLKLIKERKPINRYLIMSRLKNVYGISNRDISLEVYNLEKKMIIGRKALIKDDPFVKENKFTNDFGQILHYYIVDNEVYMRIYGLSRSKNYMVVLNYKLGSDFIDRFEQHGMKLLIAIRKNEIIRSSFIDGKRIEKFEIAKEKKEFLTKLNNNLYSVVRNEISEFESNEDLEIYLIEKTDIVLNLLRANLLLIVALLIIGIYVYIVFRSIYKNFIKMIFSIKRNIEGEDVEDVEYKIKEQKDIVDMVKSYRNEKDHVEKLILKEIGLKTRELKNLNYEINIQNDLLRDLAGKDDIMDIMGIAHEKLAKIVNVEELNFVTLLKESDTIKILRINSEGTIQEFTERKEDGMRFTAGIENKDMYIFEVEDEGKRVISVNFETKNIEWGIISIVYRLKKSYDKRAANLVKELSSLIAMMLKSAKLYEMSIKDTLTDVLNRSVMNFYIEKMMKNSMRYNKTFSIMMLDIDYFKKINDNYGHLVGDFVLKRLVKITELSLREVDTIFRYGGEEFLILLPEENREAAIKAAERVRENVMNSSLNLENFVDEEIKVTVSIGVVEYNSEEHKVIMDIVEEADRNLYIAKENGRNRVQ